jgi:hypothetical protein
MQKKNYTLPVRTNRFLYHVSYSSNRESIFKKGLIGCPKKINDFTNAIFAHNSSIPDYGWYPFCFDVGWEWDYSVKFDDPVDDFAYQMEKNGYDFWRIDTWQLKNKWFLDDIGMDDFYEGSQYPLFVVTFENIPPTVLKRYKIHAEPKIIRFNGVAHIEGRFRAA